MGPGTETHCHFITVVMHSMIDTFSGASVNQFASAFCHIVSRVTEVSSWPSFNFRVIVDWSFSGNG